MSLAQSTVDTSHKLSMAGNDKRARLTLELPSESDITTLYLQNPYRVVLELPEFKIFEPYTLPKEQKLISNIRHGQYSQNKNRIILQSNHPFQITRRVTLPALNGEKQRLVMDFERTDTKTFDAFVAENIKNKLNQASTPSPLGQIEEDQRQIQNAHLPLVMLDPGHGGIDVGALSTSGHKEKDIVFNFSKLLMQELLATKKYRVQMTRQNDIFLPLDERVRIARKAKADLFLSIHADSISEAQAIRGATIYTLSERASDTEAALLAAKENAADALAGIDEAQAQSDVANILADLTKRETKTFTGYMASGLVQHLAKSTKMSKIPHRSAGFRVLRAPDIPSLLIELGYISSEQDLKLLLSEQWQKNVVSSIKQSVEEYFMQTQRSKF